MSGHFISEQMLQIPCYWQQVSDRGMQACTPCLEQPSVHACIATSCGYSCSKLVVSMDVGLSRKCALNQSCIMLIVVCIHHIQVLIHVVDNGQIHCVHVACDHMCPKIRESERINEWVSEWVSEWLDEIWWNMQTGYGDNCLVVVQQQSGCLMTCNFVTEVMTQKRMTLSTYTAPLQASMLLIEALWICHLLLIIFTH